MTAASVPLAQLAQVLGLPEQIWPEVAVSGITHQADWVKPGDLFVAIKGARFDGHQFIAQVVNAGAVAVLGEGLPAELACPVPYLRVPQAREALADAAALLAGYPSRQLQVVGVTGTDGKTTTSWLARHLLRSAGWRTGLLSTVGYELSDGALQQFPAHFTTPEAPQVQAILSTLVQEGAQAVVLEASSHALALNRVRAVDWAVGIWTHLSSEHLDFHGSLAQYFAEKRKLIERSRFAVLNADDPSISELSGLAEQETTYSLQGPADWQAREIQEEAGGLRFELHSPAGVHPVFLPMIGRFNVANALAALAAAHHLGAPISELVLGLSTFAGVPGRMELLATSEQDPRVIVDFAHTPASLEKVLLTLAPTTQGELWVVLGAAGGMRDPLKRGPLGEVSTRLAQQVIFTEEDHRDTPLEDILDAMQAGAVQAGRYNFRRIGDRREAIRYALSHARPEDTVVLAGKGHEDTLERHHETLPWNEVEEARAALHLRRGDG